jgi:hypothetical protein
MTVIPGAAAGACASSANAEESEIDRAARGNTDRIMEAILARGRARLAQGFFFPRAIA